MTNRLSDETSPYLLQHANNPVDWYPWGEEALNRARAENRPILLSIGYSACHWCHVMAHESFENPEIAALMNELFVNIKVDREERPDLDAIYMQAVQAITGGGGWPMTVFLTPEGVPFYGGTYFPPEDRPRMPGFPRVLRSVSDAYQTRPDDITRSGRELLDHLRQNENLEAHGAKLEPAVLDEAFAVLEQQFDRVNGGFGGAPKFPQPMALEFLLRYYHRTRRAGALHIVETTLAHMIAGGIYDHLGGGFHRYSTDAFWIVPHFEKMLYDNAQLSRVLLNSYQITSNETYHTALTETLDYLLREMRSPEGGFYSTQDADSEGVEGRFFVWTRQEIIDLLGPEDGALLCAYFNVTEPGEFDGKNILHVSQDLAAAAAAAGVSPERVRAAINRGRQLLFERREGRVKPGLDDKMLTSWNGLMLRALAEAGRALDSVVYRDAAVQNAEFIHAHLWDGQRLLRSYRAGRSKGAAYLEDYACLINGLLSLYQATFETRWFLWARDLAQQMIDEFGDAERRAFFDTARDHEALVLRPKDFFDNAMPSGNSAASEALLRLSAFTGDATEERHGLEVIDLMLPALAKYPTGFGHLLCAAEFAASPRKEVAIIGDPDLALTRDLLRTVFTAYLPNAVVAGASPDDRAAERIPLLEGRVQPGEPRAYVCEHFTCQMPVSDPSSLAQELEIGAA